MSPELRTCKRCGPQTLDKFYYNSKDNLYRCKVCAVAKQRTYATKDPAREKSRQKRIRDARRLRVLRFYSAAHPQCACCGEATLQFLVLDHKDGGGTQHRKVVGEGSSIYSWVEKNSYPPMFRVLCQNCNHAYGHYGKCPHQDGTVFAECNVEAKLGLSPKV